VDRKLTQITQDVRLFALQKVVLYGHLVILNTHIFLFINIDRLHMLNLNFNTHIFLFINIDRLHMLN
jgi:hypothetical protein